MGGWADEKKEPSLSDFMMEFYYSDNRNTSHRPSAHPPQIPKEEPTENTPAPPIDTLHPSLEAYIHARYIQEFYPDQGPESPTEFKKIDRDKQYINKVTRQLESIFDSLGIDKGAFQDPKSGNYYCITTEVRTLLAFMLDKLLDKSKKTQRVIRNPPKDDLLTLRELLYDALESCKLEPDTIRYQLKKYEKKTGCPPKYFYCKHSVIVEEVLKRMSVDGEISLSAVEWEHFADVLEYELQHTWLPRFADASYKELEQFLKTINKPDAFQDDFYKLTNRKNLPLPPNIWELRQKRLLKTYLHEVGKEHLFSELWEMISSGKMLMRISEQDILPHESEAPEKAEY